MPTTMTTSVAPQIVVVHEIAAETECGSAADPPRCHAGRVCPGVRERPLLPGAATQANDTWIAACCLVYGLPLATHNVKDFADYAEHEGLELITE
jgi:hypothetical protein